MPNYVAMTERRFRSLWAYEDDGACCIVKDRNARAHIDKRGSAGGGIVVSLDAVVCCCAPTAFRIFARDTYTGPARYSPPVVVGIRTEVIKGNPDPEHISTSFAERQNLTMRMAMRRFTRLTNAFSKKFENHCHALALYFFWYSWTRQHKAQRLSPAMAAGLTDKLLSMTDLAEMVDAAQPKPGKRGPYKKRLAA